MSGEEVSEVIGAYNDSGMLHLNATIEKLQTRPIVCCDWHVKCRLPSKVIILTECKLFWYLSAMSVKCSIYCSPSSGCNTHCFVLLLLNSPVLHWPCDRAHWFTGLPETVWAAAVPMNYTRRLEDLVQDIYGDHMYLVRTDCWPFKFGPACLWQVQCAFGREHTMRVQPSQDACWSTKRPRASYLHTFWGTDLLVGKGHLIS